MTLDMQGEQQGEVNIRAMWYDFGGQDVYQHANGLFMSQNSIGVVVFSMLDMLNDSDKQVEVLRQWLVTASIHSPHSPILLVGTHAGECGVVFVVCCLYTCVPILLILV